MKRVLYYTITLALNIACVIVFRKQINVTAASVMPVGMLAASLFMSLYFNENRSKSDFNIYNDSDLTEDEMERVAVCIRDVFVLSLPLYLPFIWFFASWIKLLTALFFMLIFAGGGIYWRVRYGGEVKARFSKEQAELAEQKKKESLGRWR